MKSISTTGAYNRIIAAVADYDDGHLTLLSLKEVVSDTLNTVFDQGFETGVSTSDLDDDADEYYIDLEDDND